MLPTSPGIALQMLLRGAKPSVLREIIGPSIVETIEALDPTTASSGRLADVAAQMVDPATVLREARTRARIVGALPLPKARELAQRVGVEDGRNLYAELCEKIADDAFLPLLFSFFGVVEDDRAPTAEASDLAKAAAGYGLFAHQRAAANRVTAALTRQPNKVVLHMPTGAGKTRTAMHVVASHLRDNEPTVVCWLAQNAELLDQAADEFEHAWRFLGNRPVNLARFWGSRSPNLGDFQDGLIVGGLAKMSAWDSRAPAGLLRLADRVSLTVIDEAHQAIAPTYSAILQAFYTKRPRNALLGLTATPGRSWSDMDEDKKLSDFFDGIKVTLDVEGYDDPVTFLIEQKYLARPIFKTLNSQAGIKLTEDDVRNLSSDIDIPESVLDRLGEDTQRNLKIIASAEELLSRHRRVIVFAPSVANARMLAAILATRGHEAFVVTGESNPSERERIIRRFKSNDKHPMILINYGVLTTGFDAPSISAALIARPTQSLVLYSQMVGRATRGTRAGGNDEAEIVTVIDPDLPGFGSVAEAFKNWEDVWHERDDVG
jgi:superfamily II DNA or RNA helicase